MKKINKYEELFKTQKPVSITRLGAEFITNSSTFQSLNDSHQKMTTGLKVVGFGLFGLFAIRVLTRDDT